MLSTSGRLCISLGLADIHLCQAFRQVLAAEQYCLLLQGERVCTKCLAIVGGVEEIARHSHDQEGTLRALMVMGPYLWIERIWPAVHQSPSL